MRLKICVNFNGIINYDDDITDRFLIDKINLFIKNYKLDNIKYAYFQKSNYCNDYSIILSLFKNTYNNNDHVFHDQDLKVMGYFDNDYQNIQYLTTQTRLDYIYYNFHWNTSPLSFIQADRESGEWVHQTVGEWLLSLQSSQEGICCIGGEMGIYMKLVSSFTNIGITDSETIYNDCLCNGIFNGKENIHKVDYKTVNLSEYFTDTNHKTLIINISKSGLKNLAYQIIDMCFDHIIYIGCSEITVTKDLGVINTKYVTEEYLNYKNLYLVKLKTLEG